MPEPTIQDPWAQVQWLFDQRTALAQSKSTAANYINSKKHFLAYLAAESSSSPSPFWVNERFDEYTLLRFKAYVDELNITTNTAIGILSTTRQTFLVAIRNGWITLKSFVDFTLPTPGRETDAGKPYTGEETAAILKALHADIRFSRHLLKPYVKTGLGRKPELDQRGCYERGWWNDEDNLRWYFENVLECQPITGADPSARKAHHGFLNRATSKHGGLHRLYRKWGISAWTGPEIILPYLFKLVAETGLNPTVALTLRLDSFHESHPMTKRPHIRYWKERGSGEGDLHVELIDSNSLTLDERQAQDVKRIWEEVSAHTAVFRHKLDKDSQDMLFVYQSRGVRSTGDARNFLANRSTLGTWANDFVDRHQLKDTNGNPLKLTLARFRPSLVSRLMKRGVDIYVIQSILGHRNMLTTLRYIDGHDFHPRARKEVQKALETIRENRRAHEQAPKPLAQDSFKEDAVIFATGLASCKNVFAPPENIRKAGGIDVGSPCTYFNMCLKCSNVLITEEHLPQLFALRRQYLVAMDQGLSATPHRAAIQQSLHILNNLLDRECSDWPDDVLEEAERRSEFIESAVDPVAIREANA